MKWIMVAIATLAVSGCATKTAWQHSYKGQQQFYQDNSQCLAMSNGGGNPQMIQQGGGAFAQGFANSWNQGQAFQAAQRQQDIYTQCMYGQGWQVVKVK